MVAEYQMRQLEDEGRGVEGEGEEDNKYMMIRLNGTIYFVY